MTERKSFVLVNSTVRRNALAALISAPDKARVTIAEEKRRDSQNDKLHAMLGDLANSPVEWFGKRRDRDEWKALIVSGHAKATGAFGDVIPGLEGELVAIRESTARMSAARAASLIEYLQAYCDEAGVEMTETRKGGFYDEMVAREKAA